MLLQCAVVFAARCSALQRVTSQDKSPHEVVAVCCSVLQCFAVRCSVSLLRVSLRIRCFLFYLWRCVAVCCSVLQRVSSKVESPHEVLPFLSVAVCCSVLQCVAVCCSVQRESS